MRLNGAGVDRERNLKTFAQFDGAGGDGENNSLGWMEQELMKLEQELMKKKKKNSQRWMEQELMKMEQKLMKKTTRNVG